MIEELLFSGRMPTNVSGGQGDHTVAEGLLRRVIHKVVNQKREDAFLVVLDLVINSSLLASTADRIVQANKVHYMGFGAKSGEEQNRLLEDLIQDYIRAANKRAYTAFPRKAGKTSGGGGEREALKQLDLLAVKYYERFDRDVPAASDITARDQGIFVKNVCALVDYSGDDLEEAVKIVERAMVTALERVPFHVVWQSLLGQVTAEVFQANKPLGEQVRVSVEAILKKSHVEEYRVEWATGPSSPADETDEDSS
ncbi:hypothetical protein [Actinocrispum wychmicini]|uniref:hypothetical protein n=1 Tax=Actinocrispum wychmicini TaxID=1213861 RepID=UPI00104D5E04|nr:hypothetical protein [Actinocrispum wychmicini]